MNIWSINWALYKVICFTCTLTVKEFVKINMSKPKILLTPMTVAFIVILKNVLTLPISKSRLFNKITLLVLQQFLKKITQHRKVVLLMRLVSKYLNNTRCWHVVTWCGISIWHCRDAWWDAFLQLIIFPETNKEMYSLMFNV